MGRQMAGSGYSRALRAVVLAWGMAWFGPSTVLTAGTLDASEPSGVIEQSTEPFGLPTSTLSFGGLWETWLEGDRQLDDGRVQLPLCECDRERSVAPAALHVLASVHR